MSESDIINYLGILLRGITLFFSLVFVVRYWRRPWRALPEGRHLMGTSVVILLFMVLSFVNNLAAYLDKTYPEVRPDGNYPGRDYIALLLFAGIAYQMYRRNSLLLPDDGHENPEHPQIQKDRDLAVLVADDQLSTDHEEILGGDLLGRDEAVLQKDADLKADHQDIMASGIGDDEVDTKE